MTVRPILKWPDKRLKTVAEAVTEITDDIRAIWDDMIDTMEAVPGVGLAANQIGVMQRLAVVDGSDERGRAVKLANPEIIDASSELFAYTEGSPCLPGVSARLERPRVVLVRYLDENGMINRREFRDVESTSIQHQIDHLDGKLFFDRLSKVKRDMLLRRARKVGG